jgi:hypothetical protein
VESYCETGEKERAWLLDGEFEVPCLLTCSSPFRHHLSHHSLLWSQDLQQQREICAAGLSKHASLYWTSYRLHDAPFLHQNLPQAFGLSSRPLFVINGISSYPGHRFRLSPSPASEPRKLTLDLAPSFCISHLHFTSPNLPSHTFHLQTSIPPSQMYINPFIPQHTLPVFLLEYKSSFHGGALKFLFHSGGSIAEIEEGAFRRR